MSTNDFYVTPKKIFLDKQPGKVYIFRIFRVLIYVAFLKFISLYLVKLKKDDEDKILAMNNPKMRVMVTGANGFIGLALCKKMLDKGWMVKGVVRSTKYLNLFPDGIDIVQIRSVAGDFDWSKALINIDVIVHLAARVHVSRDSISNPLNAYRHVNVSGTERLAREAAAAKVRRFIFISSVKVHGKGSYDPYTERDTPGPLDPYGISKWEAEQALHEIAFDSGMEVVILRPPLVYGPGVKANFQSLLKVVDLGIPLPFANVKNRRSLIYIGNLVDVIIVCINHGKAAGQTYLVSDGDDVATPELIRQIAYAFEKPKRLFPFPLILASLMSKFLDRSMSINRILGSLTVDSSKIRSELNWRPPYTMSQGLKETANWYKRKLNNNGIT